MSRKNSSTTIWPLPDDLHPNPEASRYSAGSSSLTDQETHNSHYTPGSAISLENTHDSHYSVGFSLTRQKTHNSHHSAGPSLVRQKTHNFINTAYPLGLGDPGLIIVNDFTNPIPPRERPPSTWVHPASTVNDLTPPLIKTRDPEITTSYFKDHIDDIDEHQKALHRIIWTFFHQCPPAATPNNLRYFWYVLAKPGSRSFQPKRLPQSLLRFEYMEDVEEAVKMVAALLDALEKISVVAMRGNVMLMRMEEMDDEAAKKSVRRELKRRMTDIMDRAWEKIEERKEPSVEEKMLREIRAECEKARTWKMDAETFVKNFLERTVARNYQTEQEKMGVMF
ncbi:hypothetical protein EX30DRAFT_399301 [Ascodesmis nigricans]|uniref:Uncharacterized protein n=1 Tax=Ascodesmis nigricans TaxID=341454 RepID=A0A4S2MHN4_9PEZI|nr:hypothetical protein EX30DRAFT_399301 [Ascodesmis nigricans]